VNAIVQEIPQSQWIESLNDLSRRHQGWRISVEVLSQDLGAQPLVDDMPLLGLRFDPQGSEAGDIVIEIGDATEHLMNHHVDRPDQLWLSEMQPGAEVDIEIEAEGGNKTLLRL